MAGASAPRGRLASSEPTQSHPRARAMHGLSACEGPTVDSRDGRLGARRNEAARAAGVELRPLTSLADADRILGVMIATWGEHQLLPREMIRALGRQREHAVGSVRRRRVDRLRARVVRRRSRRRAAHPFAHAGHVARSPAPRGGVCPEARAARPMPGPGDPAGAVDVRSAALPQRPLQPDQARRRGGSVPAQLLRGDDRRAEPRGTERPADGPVGRGGTRRRPGGRAAASRCWGGWATIRRLRPRPRSGRRRDPPR